MEKLTAIYDGINDLPSYQELSEVIVNLDKMADLLSKVSGYIGVLVKIKNIPLEIFYLKLKKFLEGVNNIPQNQRKKYMDKYDKELKKNTSRIIGIIDGIEDEKKIEFFNNLFKALIYEEIQFDMFFRLSKYIENCIYEDLKNIEMYIEDVITEESISSQVLVHHGLLVENRTLLLDGNTKGKLESFNISNVGGLLYKYGIKGI